MQSTDVATAAPGRLEGRPRSTPGPVAGLAGTPPSAGKATNRLASSSAKRISSPTRLHQPTQLDAIHGDGIAPVSNWRRCSALERLQFEIRRDAACWNASSFAPDAMQRAATPLISYPAAAGGLGALCQARQNDTSPEVPEVAEVFSRSSRIRHFSEIAPTWHFRAKILRFLRILRFLYLKRKKVLPL